MNPLVTCIVPLYNGQRYLAEAVDSILEQTYAPIEIVLVDDGSTDGSRSIVQAYGERVRYIYKEHSGIPSTCNAGVRAARGEFISFLDADDLWLPEKTEKQLAVLDAEPHLGGCVALIKNFWVPELRDEEIAMQDTRHAQPMEGYVLQSLLARRAMFDAVGLFDESYLHASKTAWFMKAEHGGIPPKLLHEVLSLRRMHPGNFSRHNVQRSQMEYLRLMKEFRDKKRAGQP